MHANRRFVGLLDFQIIDPLWIDDKGKMSHPDLLRNVLRLLTEDDVRNIHYGHAINELGLTEEQIPAAANLLCAFIEQEVNWGIYNFQLHTHFGSTEFMWSHPKKCEYLSNAVPRDYFCSHILYLFGRLDADPNLDIESLLNEFFRMNLKETGATKNPTIQPPFDSSREHIKKNYRQYMLSYQDDLVVRWIDPFLDRISQLLKSVGPNHLWGRYYEIDDSGNVRIKYECPTKDKGEDWPIISLDEKK